MGAHNIQTPLHRRFSTSTEPESLPLRPPPSVASFDSPRPLASPPIPRFLSKTYDLTDDPSLDSIISWGEKGKSFVVWDPVEFARLVLPRNFKHSNFSSFVRQLNTYGFRKIDTDKWEFTNGGFVRGQRHLLKTIQRRKSHNPQQQQQQQQLEGSSNALECHVKELRRERRLMMEEVMGLQHEQRYTVQHMGVVEEKLEAAETRHKQMISFLATMLHSQTIPSSSRTMRRFVKHQPQLCNSDPPSLDAHDLILYTAEKGDSVAMNPADERPISSPQNVVVENGVPGFLIADDAGLEAGHPWEGYVSDYDAPHLGVGGEFLDVSEIGSMQLQGSSGIKNWLYEESPVNYIYMDPSIK